MGFSEKQREILRFPYRDYDALICDGAVRSGKTSVMSLSFFLWAMGRFNGCAFALCGKSVGAVERNIVTPLLAVQYLRQNFTISYSRSGHVITARRGVRENRFYLFGGKDESSYTLIQGITLAGVLLDEVALMPRSFVEQAMARCSVTGAKLWFNCNPEGPQHWFRAGVDSKGGGAQGPPSALHHGGQPGAGRGHPGQIPEHVLCRGVLPAVHSGPVGHVGGAYLRHV